MVKNRKILFSDGGFTLVELVLVLFFFAIVTAIAIPSFRGYIDNTKLKGAARQIVSDLSELQMRAKAESAQYRMTLNVDPTNTYTLERLTAPSQTDTKTLTEHGSDIRIAVTTFTSNRVNLEARGVTNQGGSITLRNGRNSMAVITVSLTGRANVQFTLQ